MARRYLTGALLLLLFAMPRYSLGQYFSNYDPNKDIFIHEVKLIDEFIERFNGDPSTSLKREYADKKQYTMTRSRMLVSLFDLQNTSFTDKDSSLRDFFRQVLNTEHPVTISFNDTNWYAAAQGIFLYNGQIVEQPLILHIKNHGDDWSKWMIAGIGNRSPSKEPMPAVTISSKGTTLSYISTSAYATNFVELHYILTRNIVPENFFDDNLLASPRGRQFINSVKDGDLKFLYVKRTTFHFFQVKGWAFTVDEFKRKSLNSGWLISGIHKATDAQKAVELMTLAD
jgi:hypothetical protein